MTSTVDSVGDTKYLLKKLATQEHETVKSNNVFSAPKRLIWWVEQFIEEAARDEEAS
jgi:hypothetical protein